jgi:hypothetical protein
MHKRCLTSKSWAQAMGKPAPPALALILLTVAISSCTVPVPVTKRVLGPGSVPLTAEPSTAKIHVGTTTRSDVEKEFQAVNSGVTSSRVFLARWARSGIKDAGSNRLWGARNILVQFDAQGIVTRSDECGDGKLQELLPEYLKGEIGAPTFSEPIERTTVGAGAAGPKPLVFKKDSLEFGGESIPRSSLVRLAFLGSSYPTDEPDPSLVSFDLVLRRKRFRGPMNLSLSTSISTAVLLVQYIVQRPETKTE